ncbi:MAG: hypothetical protein ACYC2H_09110 [Thermoplasmatota archaeon]
MSPAKSKKAASAPRKAGKKAGKPAKPARKAGSAKPASKGKPKTAKSAKGRPAKPTASATGHAHCAAADPFGDVCQNLPRRPSKYCVIHSYLDR